MRKRSNYVNSLINILSHPRGPRATYGMLGEGPEGRGEEAGMESEGKDALGTYSANTSSKNQN
jgi:hypothetical protein